MTRESMHKTEKYSEMERLNRAVKDVVHEIMDERQRQDEKWGGVEHDDTHDERDWCFYIMKHLGRACMWPFDPHAFRTQMVRVAALAVAAVEWCDRHHFFAEEPGPVGGKRR